MDQQGKKVTVSLPNNEEVTGWLYAESPSGLYVALDQSGNNIRFIPEWVSVSYDYKAPRATFGKRALPPTREAVWEVEKKIEEPLLRALSRLDYHHIQYLLQNLLSQRQSMYERSFESGLPEETALFSLLFLRRDYSELLEEISHANLLAVLLEHRNDIRDILSLHTLPQIDSQIAPTREIEKLIIESRETDQLYETEGGRLYLHRLSEDRIITFIREARNPSAGRKSKRASKGLRIAAATGKMAVGAGLTAANIALGVFAGVVTALPTLSLGSVAATVGIATSAYTGLNAACDGLKDLATAVE